MDFEKMNLRRVKKISYWIVFGFLLAVLIFVLFPLLPIENNYSLKMVLSGSMSPAIKTGSIVMVKPVSSYNVGNIITFKVGSEKSDFEKRNILTHRIIGQKEQGFITQGDANNVADTNPIEKEQILGKVLLDIPYTGYVANFARSKFGLVLLILIPAMIIIYEELGKIKKEIKKKNDYRKRAKTKLKNGNNKNKEKDEKDKI